jgi:sec-independent protein translocase protein TatB
MLPFGIGFSEMVMIVLVMLIVVGPKKLPEAARVIGRGIRALRKAGDELKNSLALEELKREIYQPLETIKNFDPIREVKDALSPTIDDLKAPLEEIRREVTSTDLSSIQSPQPSPLSSDEREEPILKVKASLDKGDSFDDPQGRRRFEDEDEDEDELIIARAHEGARVDEELEELEELEETVARSDPLLANATDDKEAQ